MQIVDLDLSKDTILEREDNPNKMEPEKVSTLCQLIKKLGFLQPILVKETGDAYEIVDGHHRVRAARMAELEKISAVVVGEDDDASQYADLLQIAMNQIRGELDIGMVGDTLSGLREQGWSDEELLMTGFTAAEIDDLIIAVAIDEEDVMAGAAIPEETVDTGDNQAQFFVIEVAFDNKEEYQQARKALKRAAGKGNELSVGLLNLIGAQ